MGEIAARLQLVVAFWVPLGKDDDGTATTLP